MDGWMDGWMMMGEINVVLSIDGGCGERDQ